VARYREKLMERLCMSEAARSLAGPPRDEGDLIHPWDLPYKYVFPYAKIIDKADEAAVYICFDVESPRAIGSTFADMLIRVWILSHYRCIRTPNGLATDLLSSEVDKILNGSSEFGLGRVELKSWSAFSPADGFHGVMLVYRTVDFSRV
jgi:hypothetical protein